MQHQGVELGRDGEDGMQVTFVEHLVLAFADPLLLLHRLALRAMAVPAGVVGRMLVAALAYIQMASQPGSAAPHDCLGDLEGLQGHEIILCILIEGGEKDVLHLSHG